jgi:hypothetical protein
MDIPIQRLPPMVGPRPAAQIPRLGDRAREGRRESEESLDGDGEGRGEPPPDDALDERGGAPPPETDPGGEETPPQVDLMA